MRGRKLRLLLAAACVGVLVAGSLARLSSAAFTRATTVTGNAVTVDALGNHFSVTPGSSVQPGTSTPIATGTVDTLSLAFGTVPSARTFTQLIQVTNVSGQTQTAVISLSGASQIASAVFAGSGSGTVSLASGASDWVKVTTSSTIAGHGAGTLRLALSGVSWLYRDYPLTIDEAPERPSTLSATARTAGKIALAWSASSTTTNLDGYNVYRSSGGGAYSKLNSSPLAGTSYDDTATADGTTYSYVVRAVSSGSPALDSVDSPIATATADATAPTAPTAAVLNGGGSGGNWINAGNKTSVSVSVTLPSSSAAADTVNVTLSDGSHSVSGTAAASAGAGTVVVAGLNASTLNDGSVTISATAVDAAGNSSGPRSNSASKDVVAPSAPSVTAFTEGLTPATADTVTVAAEAGSTVTVVQSAPGARTVSGTASGGSVTLTLLAAQHLQTVTLSVTATDAAGNTSSATPYTTTDQR